jgi:serine/threonine-protein kinase
MLDINPPDIRVRDLGSLFGTFVNGAKIGQREREEDRGKAIFPEHDLKDGDVVRLSDPSKGNTVSFRVGIFVPTYCGTCSVEIGEDDKARARKASGLILCEACSRKEDAGRAGLGLKNTRVCARCRKNVSQEMGERLQGEFVCAACKANPLAIVDQLLELARTGERSLVAVRGYRVVRPLGEGGMGAVYLARHEESGEAVALKIMLPRVAADERSSDRFLREIEFTKALRHRNIVRLRDSGCSHGTFFFTIDYCEGGSVQRLMDEQGGPLSIQEAALITLQAAAGLEYAHQAEVTAQLADSSKATANGVVHRDLSPHNLFLSGEGSGRVTRIGDFGLAHAFDLAGLSGQTRTGSAAGKPSFMPRQQVVNFKYAGPEVDVWAVAACFYYMVTSEYPRDFPEGQDPWHMVLSSGAVPIRDRKHGKHIPEQLAHVIDHALKDKPDIGFRTAAEFRRALECAL